MQEDNVALLSCLVQMSQAREIDEVAEISARVLRDAEVQVILEQAKLEEASMSTEWE